MIYHRITFSGQMQATGTHNTYLDQVWAQPGKVQRYPTTD